MIDITRPLQLTDGTPLTNVQSYSDNLFIADVMTADGIKRRRMFRLSDGTSPFSDRVAEYALDLTKPVQTRSGLPVRILATDRKGEQPVVAAVDGYFIRGTETILNYRLDGAMSPYGTSDGDLVNVPEAPRKRTFSVYFDVTGKNLDDLGINGGRYGTIRGRLTIDVTVDAYGVPTAVELVSNA